MGITRVTALGCIPTFMLVFVLLSLPCLQSNRWSNCPIANAFLITNPAGKQTQESFVSIQQAINETEEQLTTYVPPRIYYNRAIVNKTMSLTGTNNLTPVIDDDHGDTVARLIV